jgi:Ca2+-transporting ATPase
MGVVVSTGDNAEIGRISQMVSNVEQTKTNLLVQMEILARWLAIIVIVISLATFLLAWFRGGHGPGSAFQTAVAVAVAMIPAGLPALTTIVLAVSDMCDNCVLTDSLLSLGTGSVMVSCCILAEVVMCADPSC